MAKIKMVMIAPPLLTLRVQEFVDLTKSPAFFCHVLYAANEFIHRMASYGGDDVSDEWTSDAQAISERLVDHLNLCESKDAEALKEIYDELLTGEAPLLNDVWHLANALGDEMLNSAPEERRVQEAADWKEYLQDSLVDFWSMSGAEGGRRFAAATWSAWFYGEEESEVQKYIEKEKKETIEGTVDYMFEETWNPFAKRVKEGARNVGLGLAIGLGAGILLWLAYTATKSAGKVAAVATPQGRAASMALGGRR